MGSYVTMCSIGKPKALHCSGRSEDTPEATWEELSGSAVGGGRRAQSHVTVGDRPGGWDFFLEGEGNLVALGGISTRPASTPGNSLSPLRPGFGGPTTVVLVDGSRNARPQDLLIEEHGIRMTMWVAPPPVEQTIPRRHDRV